MFLKSSKIVLFVFLTVVNSHVYAQKKYKDSLQAFQASYVVNHEVVKGKDRDALEFFPIDEQYRVKASFEKVTDAPWFLMESSGPIKKMHRVYGKLHFNLNDTTVTLNVYQSQALLQTAQYKDYLFLPFTDATSGIETYEGGRYIDLTLQDVQGDVLNLDFNKAYNPYCAYVTGYNCPIPPAENRLNVAIRAGEKKFAKEH